MHLPSIKDLLTRKIRISSLLGMGCFFILASALAYSFLGQDSNGQNGNRPSQAATSSSLPPDSMPSLHSVGVSTLISDSGVIRYHLVAEEWDIHTPTNEAATWKFYKGLLMLRLDAQLNVDLYVQTDTAYLHRQNLWELRGRVRIRNVQGTKFNTEELFWDLSKHEMWNHTYMTIITPERTLEGTEFQSNEQMTRYSVMNSKGDFPVSDADSPQQEVPADSAAAIAGQPVLAPEDTRQRTPNSTVTRSLPPAPTKYDFQKEKE